MLESCQRSVVAKELKQAVTSIKNGKLLTSHRSTIYPCYLPVLGEFNRSWSYKTCRCKYKVAFLIRSRNSRIVLELISRLNIQIILDLSRKLYWTDLDLFAPLKCDAWQITPCVYFSYANQLVCLIG